MLGASPEVPPVSENLTREELLSIIDRAVDELLGDAKPPTDVVALAHRLGVSPDRGKKRASPTNPEQRQWVAAQAVGDHLKPELLRRLGIEGRPMLGVSLTDLTARRLLVPSGWLRDQAQATGHDLLALKDVFATAGLELIAWRLLDLDQPCIITVVDNGRVEKRRGNVPGVPRDLAPAEQACLRLVQRHSRPHRAREDGWTVQGWPAHTVDWRREVLRSVFDGMEG